MLVNTEVLLKFSCFQQLSEEQLQNLLATEAVQLLQALPGEKIITRGSNDEFSFFLVKGTLKLLAKDGQMTLIKANSDSAKQAITQLKPRQYDVFADTAASFLKIDSQALETLILTTPNSIAGIQVENEPGNADVYFQLYQDIKQDQVLLPSLAAINASLHKATAVTERLESEQLSALVLLDPSITAKLIKLANNHATKAGHTIVEVETLTQIITRLGLSKVTEIVRVLSGKDIFKPTNELHQQFFKETWREAVYISLIAAVLAEECEHLNPGQAQLVALLHNIGAMLILDSLGRNKALTINRQHMRAIMAELSINISVMLLEKWNFAEPFITAAKHCRQWKRTNNDAALDYCDLVIIAKLLSAVATPKIDNAPVLTELPVFAKLHWGTEGVNRGLHVLKQAKQKMQALTQLVDLE